ncbi:hypothetical protein DDR33_12030 [Pararcticibacter amylolyticus]|uniref:Uncharacterized protein n=1 Tax=Pararcticibacter amylolyticus TaxID=2173175 RepID=A0A2U2PG02_9SPHI|nr:hypothetical protein DDR33_12030 [Pararcticibacter amylolyticus]
MTGICKCKGIPESETHQSTKTMNFQVLSGFLISADNSDLPSDALSIPSLDGDRSDTRQA